MPTDTEDRYPCQIGVHCDVCGTTVTHDYIVSDAMDKLERFEVARDWLAKNEGWLFVRDDDLCPTCRPIPGLLHAAAQRLYDVAPDMHKHGSPLAGLADPVAKWLERVAGLHEAETDMRTPGCQWCADEDWPCSDMRLAIRVARVALGIKEPSDGE